MNLLPAFTGTPEVNRVFNVDALTLLKAMPSGSVSAVITDPPYGQTNIRWDKRVDFEAIWQQFRRVIAPAGAIVMTAVQPFTSMLVTSALDLFRYEWIYEKTMATDFLNVAHRPMRAHENVLVFSKGKTVSGANGGENFMTYIPQMVKGEPYIKQRSGTYEGYNVKVRTEGENHGTRYPRSVIRFKNSNTGSLHPTQKPLDLMEYIVNTYTNPGDLILDCFAGSGSTLVAARNLGRNFIGCDTDAGYVAIARDRLRAPWDKPLQRESAPMADLPLFAANATS